MGTCSQLGMGWAWNCFVPVPEKISIQITLRRPLISRPYISPPYLGSVRLALCHLLTGLAPLAGLIPALLFHSTSLSTALLNRTNFGDLT